MTEDERERWLPIAKAAEVANRAESTVRAWGQAGIVRTLGGERARLYNREDVERLGRERKPGRKAAQRQEGGEG